MPRHARARRRRATFRPTPRGAGVLQLPGDLVRPGLLISIADHWFARKVVAAQLDRAA